MSTMENAKEQVRQVLDRLPDNCTIEDVQYELYVVETLKRRMDQADRGEFLTHDEAKKRLEKWLIK